MTNFFLILFLVTRVAHWSPFLVDGVSMEPNLHGNELFMIDKSPRILEEIKRGDIVVFSFDETYYYVKRVIGLAGDTIKISGNSVQLKKAGGTYETLAEPYLKGIPHMYGDERVFIVPEGNYFLMGDNREHSKDSRYFTDPYIKASQLYGKYIFP